MCRVQFQVTINHLHFLRVISPISHYCHLCLPFFLHALPKLWTLTFFSLFSLQDSWAPHYLWPIPPLEQLLIYCCSTKPGSFPRAQTQVPSPPLLPCLPKRKGPDSSSLITMMQVFMFKQLEGPDPGSVSEGPWDLLAT